MKVDAMDDRGDSHAISDRPMDSVSAPDREAFRRRWSWETILSLTVIASVALFFRLPYLTTRSIWYDEASSWQTASFSITGVIESLRRNVHMPLYYWLLKAWMFIWGDSVLALRGLSVLLGVVTALAMYAVAREYCRSCAERSTEFDRWFLPSLAGLLVAVNAFQINASIEARMYALGTALSALSVWALMRVLAMPSSRRRWGVWVGLCILLTYTHHHCLFLVASQFTFLMGYSFLRARGGKAEGKGVLLWTLAAAGIVFAAYIPGLMLLSAQLSRVKQDYWTVPLSMSLVNRTFLEFASPLLASGNGIVWGGLVLGLTAVAGAIVAYRVRLMEGLVLAVGTLPMVFAGTVTLLATPVWEGRFFRFSQPFLLLILALAVMKVTTRTGVRVVMVGVLLVGMTIASIGFWEMRGVPTRPGMRGVMARIVSSGDENLTIIANSNIHYFPAKYYAPPGVKVWLLESATHEFWGDHLIRSWDVIPNADFQREAREGVWILSHSPIPAGIDGLQEAVVEEEFVSSYDHGVPNWEIHASYVRTLSEKELFKKALADVQEGVTDALDLVANKEPVRYLTALGTVPHLRYVMLDATNVGNDDLRLLAGCVNIENLSLVNTEVTDEGLPHLQPFTKLRKLDLDFCKIGDEGLQVVAGLPNLERLSLAGTSITDGGLRYLQSAIRLRCVCLDSTKITDAGLKSIAAIPNLQILYVGDTDLGDEAIADLKEARPALEVFRQ